MSQVAFRAREQQGLQGHEDVQQVAELLAVSLARAGAQQGRPAAPAARAGLGAHR